MNILAIDIGGTKLNFGVLDEQGNLLAQQERIIPAGQPNPVHEMLKNEIPAILGEYEAVDAIGICVPGIIWHQKGTVWAPNIDGWDDFPLLSTIKDLAGDLPVSIISDRAAYILGEKWKGEATDCDEALFLAIGTGIGLGILSGGKVIAGNNDIAGSAGWMILPAPLALGNLKSCRWEEYASGKGIERLAHEIRALHPEFGDAFEQDKHPLTAKDIFDAYPANEFARQVVEACIQLWGQGIANLVSLYNPRKIILGGGVFSNPVQLLPLIYAEAKKYSQPIAIQHCELVMAATGRNAALYGCGYATLNKLRGQNG